MIRLFLVVFILAMTPATLFADVADDDYNGGSEPWWDCGQFCDYALSCENPCINTSSCLETCNETPSMVSFNCTIDASCADFNDCTCAGSGDDDDDGCGCDVTGNPGSFLLIFLMMGAGFLAYFLDLKMIRKKGRGQNPF